MTELKFIAWEPIEKGWSGDRKYRVTDREGRHYLLRLSDPARYEAQAAAFERLKQAAALGLPMSQPLDFGCCDQGVYSLHSWIDGQDAELLLPGLSLEQQAAYGREAGEILRKLHSVPAPDSVEDWGSRFERKIAWQLERVRNCPIQLEKGECFLAYIEANWQLVQGRPQVLQHGDFHPGNMMIDRAGQLVIIDFDRSDYGDPWEDLKRVVWSAQLSPAFARGQVEGYFGGEPPLDFWRLLALYMALNALAAVPWAVPFGEREIAVMKQQAQDVLGWYDDMRQIIPSWWAQGGTTHGTSADR